MEILHHGEIYLSILYMFILISSLCPKTLQIFTSKMTGIGTYRNADFFNMFSIFIQWNSLKPLYSQAGIGT